MYAHQVPNDYVEIAADAVRLIRSADETARRKDIEVKMREKHPDKSDAEIAKAIDIAGRLFDERDS